MRFIAIARGRYVRAMRAIPPSMDPGVVSEVDRRLESVASAHGVRIPWAIESGSRAWGFPSPDSDYDCRFIFVRSREEYLSLWAHRDVIETPLDKVFDVNGWDLGKTITLITRGNATAIEWLRSPIVYSGDPAFRDALMGLAERVVERGGIGRHYLHVARQQRAGTPTLKRFFYVLRPAVALRWLDTHPQESLPPMDLPTLLAEASVPADVHDAAVDLITAKAVTRELGGGEPPMILDRFVTGQLDAAEHFEALAPRLEAAGVRRLANEFFRSTIA